MNHPHQAYLDEFKIAIDKMVPLTPPELVKEAKELHKQLSENPHTTAQQIHKALTMIGFKEFPYRKAYEELCASDEEQRLQRLVFERVDDKVRKKLQEITKHGIILEDYIKSPLFEEQLKKLADKDEKWRTEIESVAERLEEGWSIVERDPREEEIVKELEYWNTVLNDIEA
ncbi:hypothetical protein D6827_02980 [Candidatus Parcubacteria bacterium]|nr:MAG: hypothetical protein D6827_02980 [Candidatus Parcubacteria bacterium]